MIRLLPVLVILCMMSQCLFGQSKIDSLEQKLTTLENDSLRIVTLLHLRFAYQRIDVNRSLQYADKAEDLARKSKFKALFAEANYRKGTSLLNVGRFELAESEFDTAIQVFSELNLLENVAKVKTDLARLMQNQSKFKEASTLYFEVLPLLGKMGNKNTEARVHNYLGALYRNQKQLNKAIEHYQMALELVREISFKPGISACLANLGDLFGSLKKYETSISYLEEALSIKIETGDKLGESRVSNNLANTYTRMGRYELARSHLERANSVANEVGDPRQILITEFGIAQNAFYRNDYKTSIRLTHALLPDLEHARDLELSVKTYSLLSEAYSKIGAFEEAYLHAVTHNMLSDSLYNENIAAITNDLEARYQSEQDAQEIALLESENELQELQLQKRENERNLFVVFTLVILGIMGLLYNQYLLKRKANMKLKELDHLKSDFFANISHEFRTPLSLIMGPLKERISKSTDDKERGQFEMMYRNAERLLNLIDQLLDLSKLESGKITLERSSVEVTHFFKIIAASFSSLALYQEVNFKCELPKEKAWFDFDPDIIQKACYNLLSNAFKFTPQGGNIGLHVEIAANKLKVAVRDSGIGIPDEEQEKVFDRFFQSSGSPRSGSGVGLALTKELVEFHEGKIAMESKEGLGTLFSIEIPVVESRNRGPGDVPSEPQISAPIPDLPVESPQEEIKTSGPTILVIEDNDDLRMYLDEVLRDQYTIHKSEDGVVGIRKAKELIPDLIISDVMMPGFDGMEVCKQLKEAEETDHIPIILLTARADQESKFTGLARGADAYLLKPFDPKELKIRISNLLDQRSKLREKYTNLLFLQPGEIEISSTEESFLRKAIEVVSNYLDDSSFTADQFGVEMGMSRMQLHRKLTALTGHSATAFVRHQRLVRASQLLEAGNTVSQVAYAVGFGSPSYFTKTFKEEFGRSPSEYGQKVN